MTNLKYILKYIFEIYVVVEWLSCTNFNMYIASHSLFVKTLNLSDVRDMIIKIFFNVQNEYVTLPMINMLKNRCHATCFI